LSVPAPARQRQLTRPAWKVRAASVRRSPESAILGENPEKQLFALRLASVQLVGRDKNRL